MRKKIILLFCSVFIFNAALLFIQACHSPKKRYCHYQTSIDIKLIDNSGLDPVPLLGTTVYAKALLFKIHVNEYQFQCFRKPHYFLGINNSVAMSSKPYIDFQYDPGDFKIFADKAFDSMHPAGKDLQDLFIQKGEDYYLVYAPEDTSERYTFTAQLTYTSRFSRTDTVLLSQTPALKLKK